MANTMASPESATSKRIRITVYRVALLAAFLGFWQWSSDRLIPAFFISKPTAIYEMLVKWLEDGTLLFHAGITATEALSGFVIGGLAGVIVGTILGRSRTTADLLEPFIMAFYSLPKIALGPLFVMWLGIGLSMKIVLTATVVFFLVFLNTFTGVRNVSRELVAILMLMGANERQILTKLVIPSALTWVFAGLRISVPYALIGAIVGELIASNRGLGYLLAHSAGQFNTAGVFAALVAIVVMASLLNWAVSLLEKFLAPWKTLEVGREMSI